MSNHIKVKSTEEAGDKVILWERSDEHPNGECFLSGASDKTHAVGNTAAVQKAIRDGLLVEVKGTTKK